MRQVTDILLRQAPHAGRFAAGASGNGRQEGQALTALPGPATMEKELADLENVRRALGGMLDTASYQQARRKIEEKYRGQSLGSSGGTASGG